MKWNDKVLNISNYSSELKGYSQEVKEIVRSAILDGTPLSKEMVDRFKDEEFMLFEVKIAIDEGMEFDLASSFKYASALKMVRKLVKSGVNIKPLAKIVKEVDSEEGIKYIIRWYRIGVNLENYNFSILPNNLYRVFDSGLSLGLPMWEFNNGKQYSEEYVRLCSIILSRGKSVNKFLEGDWDIDVLGVIADNAKIGYYDCVVSRVNSNIYLSAIEKLFECAKYGMPLDRLSEVDEDGNLIYGTYTMDLALKAYLEGVDYTQLLDTEMTPQDLKCTLDILLLKKKNSTISGKLHKK